MEPTDQTYKEGRGLIALWVGILAAPICWFVQLELSFILVPIACAGTIPQFSLHLVTFISLLISAGAGFLAWRQWKRTGESWPDQSGGAVPRSRFMAATGVFLSAMFSLAIAAQGLTSFVLGACQ